MSGYNKKHNAEVSLTDALHKAIKNIMRNALIVDGEVVGVDQAESKFVCDVKVFDGGIFYDVPLKVLQSAQASFIEIPELNTKCLLCFRDGDNGRPQVFSINKAKKILVVCDLVEFNGGQLGGMVKVIDLTQRLNLIENKLNEFIITYNTHTHNVTAIGSPTGPAILPVTGTVTPTKRSDIENSKIKQ